MPLDSFAAGFVLAIVLAVVFGFFSKLVNEWNGAMNAPYAPMKVVHTTDKTPEQLSRAAGQAKWRYRGLVIGATVFFWLLYVKPNHPEFAAGVNDILYQLLDLVVKVAISILETIQTALASP